MDIEYSNINNICYTNSLGSIRIGSINFDNEIEETLYSAYVVEWSGNLDNAIISADGRLLTNLSNGLYSFKIVSSVTNAETDPIAVEISSPPELVIVKNQHSEYSCVENNGYIYVEISGGLPPYIYSLGNVSVESSETSIKFEDLSAGEYTVTITDSNGCLVQYEEPVLIKQALVNPALGRIILPQKYDSYAKVELNITGAGPFSITFVDNDNQQNIYIDTFETKYITNIDVDNGVYTYYIDNLLIPGSYSVICKNIAGCISIIPNLIVPNIYPIRVLLNVGSDTSSEFANYSTPIAIFDTFLLPYKFIESNSDLWQLIKNKKLRDEISIFIDDIEYSFKIVRNISDKYCINDNKIEILRLGEKPEDWFFYFYIAPSINISTNPERLNSSFTIKTESNTHNITLGLNNKNLDRYNPSLIIGSFILNGVGYNEFYNGCSLCLNTTQPQTISDCKLTIKNINKTTAQNMYQTGSVTILSFLEQFNILNENITIGQFACNIDNTTYQYILNTNEVLLTINSQDNLGFYTIHNSAKETFLGSLSIGIFGNDFLLDDNNQEILNEYTIEYYYFNDSSNNLLNLYKGSLLIKNVRSLEEIQDGFYVVRIRDIYGNMPRQLIVNSETISYDSHFIEAKKQIQINNNKILDQFLYGDILAYVGKSNSSIIQNINIPSEVSIDNTNLPTRLPVILPDDTIDNIINQTDDSSDTGSLSIILNNSNITCYIYGPNNYKKSFNTNTKFANLIPGVYTIMGDEQQLENNSLYQNETRIIVDKNSSYEILLNFFSYENKIVQKDL